MEVAWVTIEAIAQTQAIDLWLLFPLGQAVNRLLTRHGPPEGLWAQRLTQMFGTEAWKDAFYRVPTQGTLFGGATALEKDADFEAIGAFFAQRLETVFAQVVQKPLPQGFAVTLHEDLIAAPLTWGCPRLVFVNSMSDLFHEEVPFAFIQRVFDTMRQAPQHVFQILTKRSARLLEVAHDLPWSKNIWMGVSVEDAQVICRISHLQQVPAHVRFLSCEPLIGPLDVLPLEG